MYEVIYEKTRLAAKVLTARRGDSVAKNQKLHDSMLHEVNMLSRLEHPNIVKLIGACSVGQNLCLCTEFSDIGSLATFIHVDKQMYSLGAVYRWCTEIAVALEFIHSKQILHRDLKSANVLIFTGEHAPPGEDAALNAGPNAAADSVGVQQNQPFANLHCKIADLGLASNWLQMPKGLAGTFRWMAPEVMRGKECSVASDIYAFGMLLYEIGARETPFSFYQESPAVVFAVAGPSAARPPIPADFPHILGGIIRACWMQEACTRMVIVDAIELLKQGSNVCEVEAAAMAGVHEGNSNSNSNSNMSGSSGVDGTSSSVGAVTDSSGSDADGSGGAGNSSGSGSYNIGGDHMIGGVMPAGTQPKSVADVLGVAPAAAAALAAMNGSTASLGSSGSSISRLSESIHSAHSFQETQQRWQSEILEQQKQLPIGDDVLELGGTKLFHRRLVNPITLMWGAKALP